MMKRQNTQKTILRPCRNGRVALVLAFLVLGAFYYRAPLCAQNVIYKTRQGRTKGVNVNFRVGKSVLNTDYMGNAESFVRLDSILAAYAPFVDSVLTVASASPEGSYKSNASLANRRADAMNEYVSAQHPDLASRIRSVAIPEDWEDFRDMLETDYVLTDAQKEQILNIINSSAAPDAKEARLRKLSCWKHILKDMFPYLRFSSVVVVFSITEAEIVQAQNRVSYDLALAAGPDIRLWAPDRIPLVMPEPRPEPDRPILAVKTNLLYDAAITPNISVEIPFKGERYSAGLNYTFPWWVWNQNATAWQILHWELFGRYWFGDRSRRAVLSGWHLGLLLGGGYYDVEPKHTGYQGEFINVGVEAGYAWRLGRNWRLELGAGAGWFGTKYRYYQGYDSDKHLIWQHTAQFSYPVPMRASLSLSYIFFHKRKVRK